MKFLTGLATFAVVTGVIYYGFRFSFDVEFTAVQSAFITLLAYLTSLIVMPPEVNVAVLTKAEYEIIDGEDDEIDETND
jgi:hypothetical protein